MVASRSFLTAAAYALSVSTQNVVVEASVQQKYYHRVYRLPRFYLRLVMLDEEVELSDFQSHLQSSTNAYLTQGFQEIDDLFSLEDKEGFDSIELECTNLAFAFLGAKAQQHEDNSGNNNSEGPPTSLILATMEGYITFVDRDESGSPQSQNQSDEETQHTLKIINTALRFSLEDSINLLLSWYHGEDSVLSTVARIQVYIEKVPDEGVPADHLFYDGTRSSSGNKSRYEKSTFEPYRLLVFTVAAFLVAVAGVCVFIGVGRIRNVLKDKNNNDMEGEIDAETRTHYRSKGEDEDSLEKCHLLSVAKDMSTADDNSSRSSGQEGDGDNKDADDNQWKYRLARFLHHNQSKQRSQQLPSLVIFSPTNK